ncbi:MAG TPA: hypothetical protein VFY50_00490 [Candidatus Nitrosocosmicus sp.]|nr:hypothetical protein [Candidatus Nitrosocosmicus sp.]
MGEPLDEGSLERYDVKSPWHSSKFDVMAENVTNPSAQEPVASFEVRIEGSDILLRKRQELQILFENIFLK